MLLFKFILGLDYTMSLDGLDKMCGFEKSTFPLSFYGGQDTFSARMNFLKIWTTNSHPKIIGRFYLEYESRGEYIRETKMLIHK